MKIKISFLVIVFFISTSAIGGIISANINFSELDSPPLKDTTKLAYLKDGPYIIWKNNNKIISTYYFTDRKGKNRIERKKFHAESDTFVYKGFNFDTLSYQLHKFNRIEKSDWNNIENVMVIGDVHGEFQKMLKLLLYNKVIDNNLNWIWGNDHLVFTGDIFDRGDYVTECLWFIYKLEQQAEKTGGKVHFLVGTHELLKFTKFNGYLSEKYNYLFTKRYKLYADYYTEKYLLGKWLRSKNTIVTINGNLFVHAGISPEFFHLNLSVDSLNNISREFFKNPYKFRRNIDVQIIMGKNGPYRYRGFNKDYEGKIDVNQEFIDSVCEFYNMNRIIYAHTEVDSIKPAFNGKIINIDVPFDEPEINSQGLLIKDNDYFIIEAGKQPV